MPNSLIRETSPYLLQHAHNPVEWFAWSEEALEKAKKQNKLILASIGYSSCHWCHVMERESFEDPDVAAFMNEHFINIKIDREERPDIDQIHMEVCQLINGNGGWPLNTFLLPDGRPFYSGTYYPPRPAHGRPSWMQLLHHLYHTWKGKPETVESQAKKIEEILLKTENPVPVGNFQVEQVEGMFNIETLEKIFNGLKDNFDRMEGGFGAAPKFPSIMALEFLLSYFFYTGETSAKDHVIFSVDKMLQGGIYDQLGGGLARYATDRAWKIPHFEKMLYDNALLVTLLADIYSLTGKEKYRRAMEQTLQWVQNEMTSDEGGFYAALDADSEGEEGRFYTWGWEEIHRLLKEDARLFCDYYGVKEQGNWEGTNILWVKNPEENFIEKADMTLDELKKRIEKSHGILMEHRNQRVRPGLDDKILLDWNALMLKATTRAFKATGKQDYLKMAEKNHDFLFDKLRSRDSWKFFHTYNKGVAKLEAYLDDYAFLIEALLELYEATFNINHVTHAQLLTDFVIENFFDKQSHLFYFTASYHEDLRVRKKDIYDSAKPAGNSTMALNLQKLALITGEMSYQDIAYKMLAAVRSAVLSWPSSFSRWALGILAEVHPMREIAVIGTDAENMGRQIQKQFIPNKVIMASETGDQKFPLLAGKEAKKGTKIFLCENYACQKPVSSANELMALIRRQA